MDWWRRELYLGRPSAFSSERYHVARNAGNAHGRWRSLHELHDSQHRLKLFAKPFHVPHEVNEKL